MSPGRTRPGKRTMRISSLLISRIVSHGLPWFSHVSANRAGVSESDLSEDIMTEQVTASCSTLLTTLAKVLNSMRKH